MAEMDKKIETSCKKRATLHGAGALLAGVIIAGTLVLGLTVYAKHIDPDTFFTAQTVTFPDSQEKLEAMTAKLRAPQDVEPAAGTADPQQEKK